MAYNNRYKIQMLRGNAATINNEDAVLASGQPLYIKDRNYLAVGDGSSIKNIEPITVRSLVGWADDKNSTGKWGGKSVSKYYAINSTADEFYLTKAAGLPFKIKTGGTASTAGADRLTVNDGYIEINDNNYYLKSTNIQTTNIKSASGVQSITLNGSQIGNALPTYINNTLTVSKATTLSGTLTTTGATTLRSTLAVADTTSLLGKLSVAGETTLNGLVNANKNITLANGVYIYNGTVNGTNHDAANLVLMSDGSSSTVKASTVKATKSLISSGQLEVSGTTALHGNVTADAALTAGSITATTGKVTTLTCNTINIITG